MKNDFKQRVRTIKYGGIKYINNVSTEKINNFVREMTADGNSTMADVTLRLEEAGMITLLHDDEPSPEC